MSIIEASRGAGVAAPPATAVARIAVVGLGYVGLPTALALHAAGFCVTGIDVSNDRLATIRNGRPDLMESDLRQLELARLDRARFSVGNDMAALAGVDCVLVCVPTPIDARQVPDLEALRRACAAVVEHARAGQAIVLTSTTYVGCTRDLLVGPLAARGLAPGSDVHICFAPERVDPANADFHLTAVPKVIGGLTRACAAAVAPMFASISDGVHIVSSPEAAEMTKLLENTFRAVNITLANEFADIARVLGLSPVEVINAAATKPYGFMPFRPGPGVGGHCIPCDPHYLLWQLRDHRTYPGVISAAMAGIATRPGRIVQRVAEVLELSDKLLRGANVLVAGVAYKPNVSDIRESPALEVISGLRRRGAHVSVYDPLVSAVPVDGELLTSLVAPVAMEAYDVIVVTCRHDCLGPATLSQAALVLDATYSLPQASNCFVP